MFDNKSSQQKIINFNNIKEEKKIENNDDKKIGSHKKLV